MSAVGSEAGTGPLRAPGSHPASSRSVPSQGQPEWGQPGPTSDSQRKPDARPGRGRGSSEPCDRTFRVCPVPQGSLVTLLPFSRHCVPLLQDCKRSFLLVSFGLCVYFKIHISKEWAQVPAAQLWPPLDLGVQRRSWNPGPVAHGHASSQRREGKSSLHVGVLEGWRKEGGSVS